VLQPYSQLFAMNGGPQNILPGLLQSASMLQMGSAPQKAQTVANIIKQFGVDIATLDSLLAGEQPSGQSSQLEQLLDQRLQPIQQVLGQFQQQQATQAQQQQQRVISDVEMFASDPKNEFYNDVRADMADILDMAANRGRPMTLQDAYDRACQIHPQVSQIIAARGNQQRVNSKRTAASSLRGGPGGSPGAPAIGDSVREAVEAAWDQVADNRAGRI